MVSINNIPSINFDEKVQDLENGISLGHFEDIIRKEDKERRQKRDKFGVLNLGGGNAPIANPDIGSMKVSSNAVEEISKESTVKPSLAANTKHIYSEEDLLANTLYIFLILSFVTIMVAAISFAIREKISSSPEQENERETGEGEQQEEKVLGEDSGDGRASKKSSSLTVESEVNKESGQGQSQVSGSKKETAYSSPYQSSQLTGLGFLKQAGAPKNLDGGGIAVNGSASTGHIEVDQPQNHKVENTFSEEINDENSFQWSDSAHSVVSSQYTEGDTISTEIKKIEIFHDEINSPGLSEGSITNFLNTQFKDAREISKGKKKKAANMYSFKQLYAIGGTVRESALFGSSVQRGRRLKLSQILRFSYDIPRTVYKTAWNAEKTIVEARATLLASRDEADSATKSLALFVLLSTASSHTLLDNPNHFLSTFNDFIDNFVNTGGIYSAIENSTPFAATLIVDMVVVFCWSQWNYKPKRASSLAHMFRKWKIEPVVQNRNTIFRLICNLELGMSSIENTEQTTSLQCEFKIHTLIRECIRLSQCNDHLRFIPMIAHAVDISKMQNTKYLFYEVLFVLVQKHCDCCMSDYLNDTKTDLKTLVQHGLWHKHDQKIVQKAKDIFSFVAAKNYNTKQWWGEVHGGKTFVAATAPAILNPSAFAEPATTQRPVTPGSWRFASPDRS